MNPTNPRPRCPAKDCGKPLAALSHRVGEAARYEPYVDPVDGASLHRCPDHGRVAIRDGVAHTEAGGWVKPLRAGGRRA